MDRLKLALAAGFFAAFGRAITELFRLTVIDSTLANAVVEGLFVGAVVFAGMWYVKRSVETA
ncbi:MAG: hypothetical protein ABEJ42_09990 [Halobacteriaceae archaeon]